MKSISEELKSFRGFDLQQRSEVLRTEVCEGCRETIEIVRLPIVAGPQKGTLIDVKRGCKCDELRLLRELKAEQAEQKRRNAMRPFKESSLINAALKEATFDNYSPTSAELHQAKKSCMAFANRFNPDDPPEKYNLLLAGTYGTGKSHLSVAILKRLMERGFTGVFISLPALYTKIKSTYNRGSKYTEEDILSALHAVDCLVLDDVGAENSDNAWAIQKLFEIVEQRSGKPVIYTTNMNSTEFQEKLGGRNFSRMLGDTQIIKMEGPDYRLKDLGF